MVADLCELMGVWKIQTSPYHPQTNGQCERFNSTLINMLGTLPKEKKSEWKNHIGTLVHAYNCTQISATGFSPYYLMFGRQLCLPGRCGTWFGSSHHHRAKHYQICPEIERAYKMGTKKAEAFQAKEALRHKCTYDRRTRAAALEVGDMVLVHVTRVIIKSRIDGKIGNM